MSYAMLSQRENKPSCPSPASTTAISPPGWSCGSSTVENSIPFVLSTSNLFLRCINQ
uniref:Uncharacterized protein n=1 Tax=Arundo donax TaxID=35708 RepID=A0A0A8ZBG0_ARUDO